MKPLYKAIFKSIRFIKSIFSGVTNKVKLDYLRAVNEIRKEEFRKESLANHFPGQTSFPKKLTK